MPRVRATIDTDEMVRMYLAGEPQHRIGERFGVSQTVISDRLRKAGVQTRYQRVETPPEMIEAYLAGESFHSIMDRFQVSKSVLYDALQRAGVAGARGHKKRWLPDAEVIARYTAGESMCKLAGAYGVSSDTIAAILNRAGVAIRPNVKTTTDSDIDAMAAAYTEGESPTSIGKRYGISRITVENRLTARGVPLRTMSEAVRMVNHFRSAEERKHLSEAAREAVRGTHRTFKSLCSLAKTREERQRGVAPAEQLLDVWLRQRGVEPVLQKAIGPYNADLAIAPVAVEVFGGTFHATGRHVQRAPSRLRYFLDEGWNVVIVLSIVGKWMFTERAAEYIIAFLEQSRSDPTFRGQYRMIRSDGQEIPADSPYFNKFALVPSLAPSDDGSAAD